MLVFLQMKDKQLGKQDQEYCNFEFDSLKETSPKMVVKGIAVQRK